MFKIKKAVKCTAAAILSACIMTVSALALTGTGTVKVSTYLNVRASASSSSAIIGKLYNGTKVTITGSQGSWYKIAYNGGSAWVYSPYITLNSSTAINTVVNAAKSVIGTKYVFGGASPSTGFDCSGLTMYAYAKVGITLPHSALSQSKMGTYVSRANLRAGDLVFFDTNGGHDGVNHVGIYIGGNNIISAQSGAGQVLEASLSTNYWSNAYMFARRYIN